MPFKLQWVDPATLKLNPKNPRIIKNKDFKQLVKDIEEFPKMLELRPIVVNDDNMILGGEKRFKACVELKWKKAPVMKASDLTEAEQRKFILKDNVHAGTFDGIKLGQDWDVNELKEWGLTDLVKMRDEPTENGTIEFSEELDEESNYIVLKFDKDIDWLNLLSILNIKSTYSRRQNGKEWSKGVGRVVNGMKALKLIKESEVML